MTPLLVAVGGAAGVLARWAVYRLPADWATTPWATVGINVLGSFVLGFLVATASLSRTVRETVGVGFIGGFTTFSTFSVHIVQDVEAGNAARAALYLAASVGGGVLAAAVGYVMGRTWA